MQEPLSQPSKTLSIRPPPDHLPPRLPSLPASPPSRLADSGTQPIARSTASPALSTLSRAVSVPSQVSVVFENVTMPADLPKEVMSRILHRAVEGRGIRTRYDILLSASLVAKNWTSVAQELLCRHVVLKVQGKAKCWLKSSATHRYPIKSLEIDGRYDQITHKVTEDILFRAHGLEKLRIDFVQRLSAKIFVFQSLAGLKELTLHCKILCDPMPLLIPFQLTRLTLGGSYFPLALVQALFTVSRPTLRHLVLSLQSDHSTPLRDQILCSLSSLDALETLADWTRPHSDISILLPNLPRSLEALETAFDDVSQISTLSRSLRHVAFPNLKRIRFIYLSIEDLLGNTEGRRLITEMSERRIKIEHGFERKDLREERPPGSSSDSENSKLLQHTTRRSEETSSEASEESGEGEAASLLSGVRRTEFDIEMDAGHRRGRTTVTRGGPVSSMRDLVHNAASFVRGRSPNRRPRFSISPSPPASRSSSQSSRRSVSPSLTQYQDPVLGPFPRPKIKVDFKFPSSFNSTGLPNYPQNKYLPRRLQEQVSERQHLSAQQREVIEAGKHWRRARRRNRNSRGGEGEAEQGGPMFPCLLAAVLVVLPIALLSVVLGLVFRFAEVRI
ncbi:hypothetical protein JCM3765_006346 [Sporobolomyces pararoseus]